MPIKTVLQSLAQVASHLNRRLMALLEDRMGADVELVW